MKITSLLLLTVLALTLPCWAKGHNDEQSPVILRGKLTSLDLESNENWRIKYQGKFELQITNVGNEKIILMRRDPVGVWASYQHWTEQGELTFEASEGGELFLARSAIDRLVPPNDLTIILGPGETYTTRTTIPLEFYPSRKDHPGEPFYPQSGRAQLELTLKGQPSVFDDSRRNANTDDDSDSDAEEFNSSEMPEVLQKRWAQIGKLYLEEIESAPIEIPLPPPPDSPAPSGLVLTGHVTSLDTEHTSTGARFEIEVELQFVNTEKKPVILLRPDAAEGFRDFDLWYTRWGISASRQGVKKGKYLYRQDAGPSNSRSLDIWKHLRNALDRPNPPEEFVWVIPPGESTPPYRATITYSSNDLPASNLWLEITLPAWPFNIESMGSADDNPFGRKLREQWKAKGELELGQDCNFVSEPIELVLPHQPKQE